MQIGWEYPRAVSTNLHNNYHKVASKYTTSSTVFRITNFKHFNLIYIMHIILQLNIYEERLFLRCKLFKLVNVLKTFITIHNIILITTNKGVTKSCLVSW